MGLGLSGLVALIVEYVILRDDTESFLTLELTASGRDDRSSVADVELGKVIAANVRAERARRGWTQADLAARLGWERAAVGFVEQGRRPIRVGDLPRLCAAFGVPLARLLDGAEQGGLQARGL